MRRTTLVIWLLFFLVMFGFYFVMSWTPKLLVAAGLSAQQGITGGVLLSVGGILGAALIGGLASRWPLTRVLALFMLITAALLVLFVANGASVTAALALGLLIGLFSNGCVAGLYALSPVVYDASVRATGVGWGSASAAWARSCRRPWLACCSMVAGNPCICMACLPACSCLPRVACCCCAQRPSLRPPCLLMH